MSALRVMVVDGDRATRELLRASLTRAGYAARTSAEAGEAIQTFRRERPDVVLLDANMPGTKGSTVVQEMRALAGEHWLPIVHLTVATDDDARGRALRAGADWTLVKPCSYAVLDYCDAILDQGPRTAARAPREYAECRGGLQ